MPCLYILECANGTYYTGSTQDLEIRIQQHEAGLGANYTRKHLPVRLVYCRQYDRIDDAFLREKQVQGWSRAKKRALINSAENDLPRLSRNYGEFGRPVRRNFNGALSSVTEPVEVPDDPRHHRV